MEEIDSMLTALEDSISSQAEKDFNVPVTADEEFSDFMYHFASNMKFQLSRIVFPLPFYNDLQKDTIDADNWAFDPLFSDMDIYTVIYNTEDDMELAKEPTTSVQVEWIFLADMKLKRYYFERIKGLWKLEAIDYSAIPPSEHEGEDFLDFYKHFVTDSLFQAERLAKPTKFITNDPDNEFQVLETTLESGQWFAFKPVLPIDILTNINYGHGINRDSDQRIFEMKGFGNGFSNILYFERHAGIWKLKAFEDVSN